MISSNGHAGSAANEKYNTNLIRHSAFKVAADAVIFFDVFSAETDSETIRKEPLL